MSLRYLLDTNTVVFFLKGHPAVVERWAQVPPAEMAISAIVWHELMVGATASQAPEARLAGLRRLGEVLEVLPFTREDAAASATIHAELQAIGTPIGPRDTLIAGTARRHATIVVTNKSREFLRVGGLTVADWTLTAQPANQKKKKRP
ncbi:ribonuclease VapC [Planctomycetota bacterium]|nr:ribonuclease VapC [Planctomycetota bacterium]